MAASLVAVPVVLLSSYFDEQVPLVHLLIIRNMLPKLTMPGTLVSAESEDLPSRSIICYLSNSTTLQAFHFRVRV